VQFDSFAEALAMGGHGAYVWFVYGAACLVVILLLAGPVLRNHRIIREQRSHLRREKALKTREASLASGT
jgi:heme exporter protein D